MMQNTRSNASAGQLTNNTKVTDLTSFSNNGIITGIKVIWSDAIVGLEVLFGGQTSGLIKGYHSQSVWEENFSLTQGDYIIQVFGRHSNVIHCIGFRTRKGYTKCWGDPTQGESFTFGYSTGSYIKSLKIGTTEYVSFLNQLLMTKPSYMLKN